MEKEASTENPSMEVVQKRIERAQIAVTAINIAAPLMRIAGKFLKESPDINLRTIGEISNIAGITGTVFGPVLGALPSVIGILKYSWDYFLSIKYPAKQYAVRIEAIKGYFIRTFKSAIMPAVATAINLASRYMIK